MRKILFVIASIVCAVSPCFAKKSGIHILLARAFNNKNIFFKGCPIWTTDDAVEHILRAHSDYPGRLKKNKLIKKGVESPEGFYLARVFNSINWKHNQTFFPDHMSPEEIMKTVELAVLSEQKKLFFGQPGRIIMVENEISPGVDLKVVIRKSGELVTAYPKIRV